MTKIISAILAIRDIFKMASNLFKKYKEHKRKQKSKELSDALEKGDSVDIEKAMDSSTAGKPTVHTDGVQRRKRNKSGDVENK